MYANVSNVSVDEAAVDDLDFVQQMATNVKVEVEVQAEGSAGGVAKSETAPKNKLGTMMDTQTKSGAQVNAWVLNANTVKQLGIESSVRSAMSKQRKATTTGRNPAAIGSIVQIHTPPPQPTIIAKPPPQSTIIAKPPPQPTIIAKPPPQPTIIAKPPVVISAANLNNQINTNFNQKVMDRRKPKKFQILSDVRLTEPLIDVAGNQLPPATIQKSLVRISPKKPQPQLQSNRWGSPTPVALICSRSFKTEANDFETYDNQIASIAKMSESVPSASYNVNATTKLTMEAPLPPQMALPTFQHIYSASQKPSASLAAAFDAHLAGAPISILSTTSCHTENSTEPVRRSPPTITKDGIGLGVANASPPVLKLLNTKLRAKLNLGMGGPKMPDPIICMKRPSPIRCYAGRDPSKRQPISQTMTANISLPVAASSSVVAVEHSTSILNSIPDTTTTTMPSKTISSAKGIQSVTDPDNALHISTATTIKLSPSTSSSVPKAAPRSPTSSPEFFGFGSQEKCDHISFVNSFNASQTGEQTDFASIDTSDPLNISKATAQPYRMFDPDEADDEISDIEYRKVASANRMLFDKPTIEVVEVNSNVEEPSKVSAAVKSNKYRRIKAVPVAVAKKQAAAPGELTIVQRKPDAPSESGKPIKTARPLIDADDTESEIHVKTKKMQAMSVDRQLLSDEKIVPHKFSAPPERRRATNCNVYTTTTDDDEDDSLNPSVVRRLQRPKRQMRKVAASAAAVNVEELQDRSNVLLEQVAQCFYRNEPLPALPCLASTSSATSDVDRSFYKYQTKIGGLIDATEMEEITDRIQDQVVCVEENLQPVEGLNEIPEINRDVHQQSLHREIADENKSNDEINWMVDDPLNSSMDDNVGKQCVSNQLERKPVKPSILNIMADRLDKETLLADILKVERSRFLLDSTDDSSDSQHINHSEDDDRDFDVDDENDGLTLTDSVNSRCKSTTIDSTVYKIYDVSEQGISERENEMEIEETIVSPEFELVSVRGELVQEDNREELLNPVNSEGTAQHFNSDNRLLLRAPENFEVAAHQPLSYEMKNEMVDDAGWNNGQNEMDDESERVMIDTEAEATIEIETTDECRGGGIGGSDGVTERTAVDIAWSQGVSNQFESADIETVQMDGEHSEPNDDEEPETSFEFTSLPCDENVSELHDDAWAKSAHEHSSQALQSQRNAENRVQNEVERSNERQAPRLLKETKTDVYEFVNVSSVPMEISDIKCEPNTLPKNRETSSQAAGSSEVATVKSKIKQNALKLLKSPMNDEITIKREAMAKSPAHVEDAIESLESVENPNTTALNVRLEHESQSASPMIIIPVPRKRLLVPKITHTADKNLEDLIVKRNKPRRIRILDSSDDSDAALVTPKVEVTESPAVPVTSKRKRTVQSYADFFTDDEHKKKGGVEKNSAKRIRQSLSVSAAEVSLDEAEPLDNECFRRSVTPTENVIPMNQETPLQSSTPAVIMPKTKRGRRPAKALVITPTDGIHSTNAEATLTDEMPITKRGRGRPRFNTPASDERPKVKRVRQSAVKFVPIDVSTLPAIVTCGNCKEQMESQEWSKHVDFHYGLAWLDGIETAVNMENINSRATKMINYMKAHKLTALKCHNCPDTKRSAIGYMSHIEVCGLSREQRKEKMYQCPYCPSLLRKVSIPIHNDLCVGLRELRYQHLLQQHDVDGPTSELDEIAVTPGRKMRVSAKKAIKSFKAINVECYEKPEDCIRRLVTISTGHYMSWALELNQQGRIKCRETDCDYQASDRREMSTHYKQCVQKRNKTHYCGRCNVAPGSYEEMLDHVKSAHELRKRQKTDTDLEESGSEAEVSKESSESHGASGVEESESDGAGEPECEENDVATKKRSHHGTKSNATVDNEVDRQLLDGHARQLKVYSASCFFKPAIEWTREYRDTHFYSTCAYPFALPVGTEIVGANEADKYLPVAQKSAPFQQQTVDNYSSAVGAKNGLTWSRLDAFASATTANSYIIYTGGPVQVLEWLPLPDSYTESQLLAVVCKRDARERIYNDPKQPSVRCTLQIWNIERLACTSDGDYRPGVVGGAPRLLYNVACDDGPIMACAFCPSGGYTDDRLGLVALPTHDGDIRLVALPKNFTCDNSGHAPMLRLQPALVLTTGRGRKANEQITKIAWSKTKGHQLIVAGYANGLVVIWRLTNMDSPLIAFEVEGMRKLLPIRMFYALNGAVTLIDMHHDMYGDSRWMIVGGHDHKVRFYDLQGSDIEVSVAQMKSRITSGVWPLHWTTFVSSIDDTYCLYAGGISVRQPLDLGIRTSMIHTSTGPACEAAYSDWLHTCIFATGYGELRVSYFQQFISGFIDQHRRRKAILGYTDIVQIDKVPAATSTLSINEDIKPTISSLATGSPPVVEHGIVFYDLTKPLPSMFIKSPKLRVIPLPLSKHVRINRVAMNPNANAYKWYAIGYELGFVRIKYLMPMIVPRLDGRSMR